MSEQLSGAGRLRRPLLWVLLLVLCFFVHRLYQQSHLKAVRKPVRVQQSNVVPPIRFEGDRFSVAVTHASLPEVLKQLAAHLHHDIVIEDAMDMKVNLSVHHIQWGNFLALLQKTQPICVESPGGLTIVKLKGHCHKMAPSGQARFANKQVELSARLVNVDKRFARQLGVQLGLFQGKTSEAGLNIDLPAGALNGFSAASLGVQLAHLGSDHLLDLTLSALESQGDIDIISSPHLVTENKQMANIEIGEEIPYQESTYSGGTATAFKKAALSLQVTPRIKSQGYVSLKLAISQNKRGEGVGIHGPPAIDTREIRTRVQVKDGETIVLGGIKEETHERHVTRIPLLSQLPLIGRVFQHSSVLTHQQELYVFITPHIV